MRSRGPPHSAGVPGPLWQATEDTSPGAVAGTGDGWCGMVAGASHQRTAHTARSEDRRAAATLEGADPDGLGCPGRYLKGPRRGRGGAEGVWHVARVWHAAEPGHAGAGYAGDGLCGVFAGAR